MIKFTVTSTKGGVGKTTLTANLGGLLADLGLRVLLVDADVQPSLSKYFPFAALRPDAGLTEVIVRGEVTPACITPTLYRNLDIVVSDDPEGRLPHWLLNRIDRGVRLRMALQTPAVVDAYDCVLIDTPCAVGPLQDAAVLAADILISPITPEILSAREFRDGTMELLERLAPGAALGAMPAPLKAVIYRQDRTVDARMIACGIREDFPGGTAGCPCWTRWFPTRRPTRKPPHPACRCTGTSGASRCHALGLHVMHRLAWELIPSLQGILVGR
jgi:chromosome partitioning related protein ParA